MSFEQNGDSAEQTVTQRDSKAGKLIFPLAFRWMIFFVFLVTWTFRKFSKFKNRLKMHKSKMLPNVENFLLKRKDKIIHFSQKFQMERYIYF